LEIIAGIRFEKFSVENRSAGKRLAGSMVLTKQFGGHCLRIYLVYADDELREQLLTILRASGFTPAGNNL
jgi:hypothetical protein